MNEYQGKKVAILGFGLEGRDSLNYLIKRGADITVFDKKNEDQMDLSGLDRSSFKLLCGEDYLLTGLSSFNYVFRSPGVYRYIRQIVEAEKKGVKITSNTKEFFKRCSGEIIGVTGTKGKGTTATLVYEILKNASKDVFLAGNIGSGMLELLPMIKKDSLVVLELSSFQLIDLQSSPHIAVVLNITSDHLDWHKDQKEYLNAKKNIVKHQKASDYTVLNSQYRSSKDFANYTRAKVIYYSKDSLAEKFKKGLILRGEHNWENIAAAVAVSKIYLVDENILLGTIRSFKSLEHRLEYIGSIEGIDYYNDSFATNPLPTLAALHSFKEPITVILGGYDKGLDYDILGKGISKIDNINNIILIGQVENKIFNSLKRYKFKGKVIKMGSPIMTKIVEKAREISKQGGVVLLSPAAASFDMFSNYKERGKEFKKEVLKYK